MMLYKKIIFIFAFLIANSNSIIASEIEEASQKPPLLVLYFDINGTVILNDSSKKEDFNFSAIKLLADSVKAKWSAELNGEIPYSEYIKILVPGDRRIPAIKAKHDELYSNFLNYLQKNHPDLYGQAKQLHLKILDVNAQNPGLFPSFYYLIEQLIKSSSNFKIVFRSFGDDIPDVVAEVQQKTGLVFEQGRINQDQILIDKNIYQTISDIWAHIQRCGHSAWRDDFNHWKTHGETEFFGKPFLVDSDNKQIVSLFFDDNIHKGIVHVVSVNGREVTAKELIDSGHIVCVDTLQAMINPQYYYQLVKKHLGYVE